MDDNTMYTFSAVQKGYEDSYEHRVYPDIAITQHVSFDGTERWPDVMRAFARFLGNVYGYSIEEKFDEIYVDPIKKWEEEIAAAGKEQPKKKTKKAKA